MKSRCGPTGVEPRSRPDWRAPDFIGFQHAREDRQPSGSATIDTLSPVESWNTCAPTGRSASSPPCWPAAGTTRCGSTISGAATPSAIRPRRTSSGREADIESAIDELRDTTGIARVSLAGLRIGGALAARVAVRRPEAIDRLVLWDAVISGTRYLEELRGNRTSEQPQTPDTIRRSAAGGGWEVRGFPLTDSLAREIEGLDLLPLAPALPRQTFLLASRHHTTHAPMAAALAKVNHPAVMEEIEAAPAWLEERNLGAGAIPVNLLHRIVSWLS